MGARLDPYGETSRAQESGLRYVWQMLDKAWCSKKQSIFKIYTNSPTSLEETGKIAKCKCSNLAYSPSQQPPQTPGNPPAMPTK